MSIKVLYFLGFQMVINYPDFHCSKNRFFYGTQGILIYGDFEPLGDPLSCYGSR